MSHCLFKHPITLCWLCLEGKNLGMLSFLRLIFFLGNVSSFFLNSTISKLVSTCIDLLNLRLDAFPFRLLRFFGLMIFCQFTNGTKVASIPM